MTTVQRAVSHPQTLHEVERPACPGIAVGPLNTLAKDHLQAPLLTHFPSVLKVPHSWSSPITRMSIYFWHLASSGPTPVLRPTTCWGWGGDSFQTEESRGAESRGTSEARRTTEMARGAGQALRGHGEKHPGETERSLGVIGTRGLLGWKDHTMARDMLSGTAFPFLLF